MKLMIATTVLALTSGMAFAQEAAPVSPEMAFVDAAAVAAGAAEGDLIAMELDYLDEGAPVYLADLESETGFARLMLDGDSGAVLASETISGASEEALDAYLEYFGTHAEMAALNDMFDDVPPEFHEMSGDDIAALETLFDDLDDAEIEVLFEDLDDAEIEALLDGLDDAALDALLQDMEDAEGDADAQ